MRVIFAFYAGMLPHRTSISEGKSGLRRVPLGNGLGAATARGGVPTGGRFLINAVCKDWATRRTAKSGYNGNMRE